MKGATMETLTVTSDLRIEIDDTGNTPLLYLYSEGMRADGETGVIVWPNEVKPLVAALCEAAGILAVDAARSMTEPELGPLDPLTRAKRDLAALERGEPVDLSAWGVKDLRAG